jgi:hypothetical protein
MFEFLFGSWGHDHHAVSVFAKTDDHHTELLPAMGMDPPLDESGQPEPPTVDPTEDVTKGPIEYVFRVETATAQRNAEGILTTTGTANSAPLIRFIGSAGKSELIPIKLGIQSGKLYEFSAVAKDVGPVKSIEVSDPRGTGTWNPTEIDVNRIPSLAGGKDQPISKPDGWVVFKIGKAIGSPQVFEATKTENAEDAAEGATEKEA